MLIFPRMIRVPAIRVLLICAFFWLITYGYFRHRLWRDPHSAFFDDQQVYDLKYSLYRERQARHFISRYNSLTDVPDVIKGGPNPAICAIFVTVKRGFDEYFEPSIGSLLEGLDPRERHALRLNVLFADTDPTKHSSWDQRWVERLTDSASMYNVTDEQFERVRQAEKERNFYVKGVFDYTYALATCQASGAPYTIVFEDDIILAHGWMAKAVKAIATINKTAKINNWIYLRLFYTETSLGWSSSDFAYRNMPIIFILAILLALAIMSTIRRSKLVSHYLDNCTIAVICLVCVPGIIALIYMTGKYTLMPLRGVVEMNSNGCCTQGLVFPQSQVDGLLAYLQKREHGQTDSMIEEYAEQSRLTRYALAPQQLQHVGLQSSRDNDEITTKSTWAFWFEENNPALLRKEHEELLRDKDVVAMLDGPR